MSYWDYGEGIIAGLLLVGAVELVQKAIRDQWAGSTVDYLKVKAALLFYPAPKMTKKPTTRNLLNKIDSL